MLAIILMIAVTVEAKNVMCNNMIKAISKVAVKIVRIEFLYADFYKDFKHLTSVNCLYTLDEHVKKKKRAAVVCGMPQHVPDTRL